MQSPLSYREVCSLPPACPPSPLFFHLHTPMHHPNTGRHLGEFPAQGSQPRCPACHGRTRHKALAHRDTRQLPRSPHPSSPQHHPARPRSWRWHPKGGGGRRRVGTHPWALLLGAVPAGVGGTSETRPPRPLPGESLAAGAGTGTSLGGRWPPSTSGKGTIPGHFFFGRPRVPPLCTPVLLPRSGAGTQLNQCSANNLPANKTFSSLSLLPPTPPQSVCDGSALI